MARAADMETLLKSLLPLWRQRLRAQDIGWSGAIELVVDARCWALEIDGRNMGLNRRATPSKDAVSLAQQQFIQLCFAYPVAYVAANGAFSHRSPLAQEALAAIFARDPFWIAGTDGF